MTGDNETVWRPTWKVWLRRFLDGYKFSNTGFKRLFIVGLVATPVFIGIVSKPRDYYDDFSFGEFWGITFVSLLAYLLIVRVVRWVWDGFAATDRARNGASPSLAVSPEAARNQQTPKPPPEKSGPKPEPFVVRRTPTAWLSFWTYIRLPLGGVVGILEGVALLKTHTSQVELTVVFITLGISLGILAVAVGLHHREPLAWKANMIIIFAEPVLLPLTKLRPESTGADLITALITTVILWGVWSWPNYIYFKKRKSLFTT